MATPSNYPLRSQDILDEFSLSYPLRSADTLGITSGVPTDYPLFSDDLLNISGILSIAYTVKQNTSYAYGFSGFANDLSIVKGSSITPTTFAGRIVHRATVYYPAADYGHSAIGISASPGNIPQTIQKTILQDGPESIHPPFDYVGIMELNAWPPNSVDNQSVSYYGEDQFQATWFFSSGPGTGGSSSWNNGFDRNNNYPGWTTSGNQTKQFIVEYE